MTPSQATHDDLSQLFAEANARTCGCCGKQSLVQAQASADRRGDVAFAGAMAADATSWFCFECGHVQDVSPS